MASRTKGMIALVMLEINLLCFETSYVAYPAGALGQTLPGIMISHQVNHDRSSYNLVFLLDKFSDQFCLSEYFSIVFHFQYLGLGIMEKFRTNEMAAYKYRNFSRFSYFYSILLVAMWHLLPTSTV